MNASLSEIIQLSIGAFIGFGLSLGMEKNGISVFKRDTRMKALCYLIIFCSLWIIGMTVIENVLGH